METSRREVMAKDITDAIGQMQEPSDVVSAERQIKMKDSPFQRYVLKLERVVNV